MNSAGDKKTSPRTIFPWQLDEDNPVISRWGNNLLNKAGEMLSYSAGDKLQESTGDKLPESTGEMVQLSWGNFWTVLGGMAPLGCLVFCRGIILY